MTRHLIDAHLHLWELDRHPQPWIDPGSMSEIHRDFTARDAAELGGHGIADAVVVQADNTLSETEDLLAAAAAETVIKAVVGWVDLLGDVPGQLGRLRGLPGGARLAGVRHLAHLEPDPSWLLRPDVVAGLTAVAQADLVVELVVRAHQLPVVAKLVDALPAASFVLDHLGKPPLLAGGAELERWRTDLAGLAQRANVAEAALAFPLLHPAVVNVTLGMRTAEQVDTNVALAEAAIPDALWQDLAAHGLVDERAVQS